MASLKILKKIIIAIVALISIVTILAIVYYSLFFHDIGDSLISARKAYDSGNKVKALELINSVLEKDATNLEAIILFADISRENGDYLSAAKKWSVVSSLDPFNSKAVEMQAVNLIALGAYTAVVELIKPIYDKGKASNTEKICLAQAYSYSNKIPQATEITDKILSSNPEEPNALLLLGNISLFNQEIKKAEVLFSKVKSKDSAILAARDIGLANCAESVGDRQKAEGLLKDALTISGNSPQANLILADFYARNEEFDKATPIYKQLLDSNPSSIEFIVPLGEIYAAQEKLNELNDLSNSITFQGLSYLKTKYYLKALSYFIQNDYKETIKYIEWAGDAYIIRPACSAALLYSAASIGDLKLTLKGLDYFLPKNTGIKANKNILGFVILEADKAFDLNNDYKFATAICKKVIKYDSKNTAAHVLLMWCYLSRNMYNESNLEATLVLADNPNNISALEVSGRLKLKEGNISASLENFESIIKIEPNSPLGYYWKGLALMQNNDFEGSKKALDKALEVKPDSLQTLNAIHDWCIMNNNDTALSTLCDKIIKSSDKFVKSSGFAFRGDMERSKKNLDKAISDYRLAIEQDPENLRYYLILGRILSEIKIYQEAKDVLERAMKKSPKDRYVLFELAYLENTMGNTQQAIDEYKKIVELYPDWYLPYLNLSGLIYQGNASDPKALDYAIEATKVAPALWITRFNAGERYFDRKKYTEARQEFVQVLKLNPGSKESKDYIARIDTIPKE